MTVTLDQDPSAELDTSHPGLDVREKQAMQVPSLEPIPGREDLTVLCFCQGAGDADANRRLRPHRSEPCNACPFVRLITCGADSVPGARPLITRFPYKRRHRQM